MKRFKLNSQKIKIRRCLIKNALGVVLAGLDVVEENIDELEETITKTIQNAERKENQSNEHEMLYT